MVQDIVQGMSRDIGKARAAVSVADVEAACGDLVGDGRGPVPGRGGPASTRCRKRPCRGWLARYRAEGDAAFEPRSRRPQHVTDERSLPATVELIVNLRRRLSGRGPRRRARDDPLAPASATTESTVSISTIRRRLRRRRARQAPNPKKRPQSSYIRFEAELPNEMLAEPTSPTGASPTATDGEILHLARRPLPLRPVGHRPPPGHRPDRGRHLPRQPPLTRDSPPQC